MFKFRDASLLGVARQISVVADWRAVVEAPSDLWAALILWLDYGFALGWALMFDLGFLGISGCLCYLLFILSTLGPLVLYWTLFLGCIFQLLVRIHFPNKILLLPIKKQKTLIHSR